MARCCSQFVIDPDLALSAQFRYAVVLIFLRCSVWRSKDRSVSRFGSLGTGGGRVRLRH